ncbi:hypothetical protein ACFL18_01180 [Patescibacteria group bacterium]
MNNTNPITKKTKSALEKTTDKVSAFLGSWSAVIFHVLWFSIWLVFNYDINILTFSVSLEAIFIGIFLLMAANKAEASRDKKEERLRKKDRARLEEDIKLDERSDRQLQEVRKNQQELNQKLDKILKQLQK